ncbi:MAG: Gfo/Idh/MocA family oxidoreductase [Planctomycetaceae bacterium]|nr:Gfo/Idh/MocA family oxidoreductase [Planctomycetaceae bacterium]
MQATVRYGIVGLGAWGRCYANAIQQSCLTGVPASDVTLTAIATGKEETVAAVQAEFPDAAVVADHRNLVTRDDVDVVAVVAPNHLHYAICTDALNAGKHLLVEKPFTLTVEDCEALIRLADAKKCHLMVGHQFRLSSLWGKIKELIDDGFLGRPKYALIELSRNPYRQGDDGWRYDQKRVGNWILEEPVHFLDLACWYFEKFAQPVSLYASANQSGCTSGTGQNAGSAAGSTIPELYDNLSAVINFSDGSHATVAQTLSAFEHHQTVKISGTCGALWAGWSGALDRTRHPDFFLKTFDGNQCHQRNNEVVTVPITKMTGELYELEDQIALMADVVRGKAEVHCTGKDGCRSVMLSNAAQESARTGNVIKLT